MILEKLLESPKTLVLVAIAAASNAVFVVLNLIMAPYSAALASAGATIIELEFVWTPTRASEVIGAYIAAGALDEAITLNYVDFAYMPAYGLMVFSLVLLVSRALEGKAREFGPVFAVCGPAAAAFDVVENVNLLAMLGNPSGISSVNASLASTCATVKFSLLFAGIGFFLAALILLGVQKLRK
ncbi:MAG: hypothetical protein ACTSU5_19440 [Promethearchaeota archaeon]